MKVAIAGSSGLIGTGLVPYLEQHGHEVVRLVRRTPGRGEVRWDPRAGALDPTDVAGVEAFINLAGAGIGDKRWTDERKHEVVESRTRGTRLLAEVAAAMPTKPKAFLSGSAVGWYGSDPEDDGDKKEGDPRGAGFLADVVELWEQAAAPAVDAGIRTVYLRSGIVLSTAGGALAKQLLPFKLGLGGRLGSGRQQLSWISLADEVAAIAHCLTDERLSGPVNLTAPTPVSNLEFTKALGAAVHRPTLLPIPLPPLRLLFGAEMVDEMLLGGQRALPTILAGSGFAWRHVTLDEALAEIL